MRYGSHRLALGNNFDLPEMEGCADKRRKPEGGGAAQVYGFSVPNNWGVEANTKRY